MQIFEIKLFVMTNSELEERLVDFAGLILEISDKLPESPPARQLSRQLIRSGTSTALNYGEARSAESKKDFIHKIQIILKELRETFICLKLIEKAGICKNKESFQRAYQEANELISIFVKTTQTARKRS